MENEIIVSVIVPVYNAETFLRKTLDCICGQTLRDIEIILVDDGSTDETPAILQEYADRDSRIILLNQEHEYAGAARNKGMAIARGKYYSFLDADDIFDSTMLEKMVTRAEEVTADVVVCRCDIFHTEGEYTPLTWQIHDRYLTKLNPRKFSLKKEYPQATFQIFIGWAWDKLFRAEYVKKNGFLFGPTRHGNDGPFVFPAVAGADCISIIDESLVKYRRSPNQISNNGNLTKNPTAGCTSVDYIAKSLKNMELPEGTLSSFYVWIAHYIGWNKVRMTSSAQDELVNYLRTTFEKTYNVLRNIEKCKNNSECRNVCNTYMRDINRYKSMISPTISVIIPVYNASKYLIEAMDSLLQQTYTDFEAICVNDGSTDNSLEILKAYAAKDTRIRILDGPNGGYGKAMNRGMEIAAGKYIAIFEPDDVLPSNAYELLISKALQHDADITKGCVSMFTETAAGREIWQTTTMWKGIVDRKLCPRKNLPVFSINMTTWTALYKSSFLKKHHILHHETPGASYQDNGFFFLTFAYAESLYCTNDVVYFYRTDNPNSSIHALVNKPYAMRDEYAHIRKTLLQTPEIWQIVRSAWLKKRFDNHFFTYRNIKDSIKLDYLEDFRKELCEIDDIDCSLLGKKASDAMAMIMQSPLVYLTTESVAKRMEELIKEVALVNNVQAAAASNSLNQNTSKNQGEKESSSKNTLFYKKTETKTSYKFFGVPVWTIRNKNGKKKYLLFGIRVWSVSC